MRSFTASIALAVLYSGVALAAPDLAHRNFAVMSLIGDSLTIVTDHPTTGSHLDRNDIQTVSDPSAAVDTAALHATKNAIRTVAPAASPTLLATDSPILRKQQSQLIEGQHLRDADGLVGELKKSGATDLFLITKHRADTNLQARFEALGNGTLYGLGFYVDGHTRVRRNDTLDSGIGYLAPYAYFNIYLIDVATLAVKSEKTVTASDVISNAKNKVDGNPWNILSADEKIRVLDQLVSAEIAEAVPGMILGNAQTSQSDER